MTHSIKFLDLQARLEQRLESGLYRSRRTLDGAQQACCYVDGKALINFSSNDYLGLANSCEARVALTNAAAIYGYGSGASHLISGHQRPHETLEKNLAEFVERDAAVTFSTGYMANLAILQTLAGKGDVIIADKLNHASLIDGARLSQADSLRYPHCDLNALENRLKKAPQNKFVVTDSVFSMDGDIAPLDVIAELCDKYQAILIVDDAHGFGVLGKQGRGCGEYFGLNQKQLPVLMSTLGKSLGGFGAFISGEQQLVDYLIQFARSYIYTTAMPAVNAAANLANLQVMSQSSERINQLKQNIEYFRHQCALTKLKLENSTTAIQPLLIGENQRLMAINEILLSHGLLVGAIRPPTVPQNSARLRITITATHTAEQIDLLIKTLNTALEKIE